MQNQPGPQLTLRHRSDALRALLIGSVALITLLATDRDYAMVWDEGHTIRREQSLANWFALCLRSDSGRAEAFTPAKLAEGWPFSREEPDGHPPVYALLGLAGWWPTQYIFRPLTAYRLGPMILAAATIGIVYFHMTRRRGPLAGLTAAGSILLIPQAFSLAHYAHYDMAMSCLWLLAIIAFLNALKSPRWSIPFGIALGLSASTKFTGIFAIAAPLVWVAWTEWISKIPIYPTRHLRPTNTEKPGTRVLIIGILAAIATSYATQPTWWFDPLGGPMRFIKSNLTRSSTIPIPSQYLGSFYRFALPWHNTIVLTLVSIPVGIVVLGITGIIATIAKRGKDPDACIWFLSWGTLIVVRALPFVPGHDGIRLILPSVLSLAMLAGIGIASIRDRLTGTIAALLPPILSGIALCGALLGIVSLYPYTLSYYSEAIGGLKGASRLGFETTYYWDTMGPEFLDWIRQERSRRPLALRFPSALVNPVYLREWGDLPADVPIFGLDSSVNQPVYVAQRRLAMFYPYDWWLEKNGHPIFTIRRQGVDLLRVYSNEESVRAAIETRNEVLPTHLVD